MVRWRRDSAIDRAECYLRIMGREEEEEEEEKFGWCGCQSQTAPGAVGKRDRQIRNKPRMSRGDVWVVSADQFSSGLHMKL